MTEYQAPCFDEWDDWEQAALERGLDKNLATLGRAVMREAVGHAWSPQVARLCGEETLDCLLAQAPTLAKRLYELLLETDGLRVAFVEDGEHTTSEIIELDHFRF